MQRALIGARLIKAAGWMGLGVSLIAALLLTGLGQPPMLAFVPGLMAGGATFLIGRHLIDRPPVAALPAPPSAPVPTDTTLATVFEQPVIVMDEALTVQAFSAAASALFPALTPGRNIALAIRDPEVLAAIARAGASVDEQRAELTERGNLERQWQARIRPVRADAGKPRQVALLLEDLTEQRALERLRVDFIANASHELRTPLASVLGFIETLQGPARHDQAARERFLPIMREQAARMSRLIDDLLSLSRAELRAHQPPTDEINLVSIAREITDSISLRARERSVVIELSAPVAQVQLRGDRDDLLRLTENLVENGIRYGRSGGRVILAVARDEAGHARLSVRDFGPGLNPKDIPRLTERFYRADKSHSREQDGTGLGLAIVKHIALRHGARLDIANAEGGGAVFTVTFPQAAHPGAQT